MATYTTLGQQFQAIIDAITKLLQLSSGLNAEQILQSSESKTEPRLPNLNQPWTIKWWFESLDLRSDETMGAGRICDAGPSVVYVRLFTRNITKAGTNTTLWDAQALTMLTRVYNGFHLKNLFSVSPDLPWLDIAASGTKLTWEPMRVIAPFKPAERGKGTPDDSWGYADMPVEVKFIYPLVIDADTGL